MYRIFLVEDDETIAKPFDLEVLTVKIQAIIRRCSISV